MNVPQKQNNEPFNFQPTSKIQFVVKNNLRNYRKIDYQI